MLINYSDDKRSEATSVKHKKSSDSDAYDFDPKTSLDDDEDGWSLSCCQKFRLFLKQTCKDICRHKC